ncbi:SLBB domain-containing protein [Schauerella aestuarii]|uniref:SLBB domain-containing protein n=1 Tax=Schauerella aestuarii TaxID=2511204 RepID=UPI00137135AA|nr:SLBB domain-containing protein [Achromobacter aestuarii]MYZ45491.1 sugar transporter [Achromobacter aestuarii]
MSAITNAESERDGYTVIDLNAANSSRYARSEELPPNASVAQIGGIEIKLAPGDVLRIMISDSVSDGAIFAPLSSGGTVFSSVRVGALGFVSIPYAGQVKVSGRTLRESEIAILEKLKGVVSEAQIHLEIISDLSGSVLVAGAVRNPGRFSVLKGPLTLLDAINMAGGPIMEPHLTNVILRTGNEVTSINYQELLGGLNRQIPPRSEIVVERAKKRFVAMGAVNKPGLHDMPSEFPTLLEALGMVGGLNERSADPRGVFIFRSMRSFGADPGKMRTEVIRLDMRAPSAIFLAKNFLLRPEDAIYVTNSPVYEWQKIISPIVQTLILGQRVENF